MKNKQLQAVLKWGVYSLLLLAAYMLQTMPGFLTIFGAKPVFLVAVAVGVSMYENVLSSGIFCGIAGLLWDISSDRLFGFNGLILLLCGVTISVVCVYFLHTRMLNAVGFCAGTLLVQGVLDYLFCFLIWRYPGAYSVIYRQILPCAAYTVAVFPLIYLLIRKIAFSFHHAPRA